MSIFDNAIDSIVLGIEDYQSPDSRRLISCTRNLLAGILLLFKHKLVELSPPGSDEALIKQRVLPTQTPSGDITWQGDGTKTVDVQQIQERFESLKIAVDWTRVKAIVKYRNDIEHYHSSMSHKSVRALIADSFIVIRDFLRAHLQLDPLDVFGEVVWTAMTDVNEVYEKEKAECVTRIAEIDWRYESLETALTKCRCKQCGSGLLDVVNEGIKRESAEFKCRSCGQETDFETMAADAVQADNRNSGSIAEGGNPNVITCPECGMGTYVLDEDVCILCENSVERECQRCGNEIPIEELDGEGFCGWCQHMMAKDD